MNDSVMALRGDLAALRMRLALARLALKAGFDPSQPRVPRGVHGGGQWAGGDGFGGSSIQKPLTEKDINKMKFASDHAQVLARAEVRQPFVLAGGGSIFEVAPNPSANSNAPWNEIPGASRVDSLSAEIEASANKEKVNPDLIRTIIYMETTHGWYDKLAMGANDTILPMNVSVENWGKALGLSRSDFEDPAKNIDAGTKILKGIIGNLPNKAPVSVIATLYNVLGAPQVNSYGARAQKIFQLKPWKK